MSSGLSRACAAMRFTMKENDQSALTKGQRTTHRILDAAEVQFAAHGYGAASLRDIAAAADIQQPGLYKHFSSKEELYQRVCERALSPLVDFMDELLERPVDQMIYRELTDRMTDLLAQHPHVPRLLIRATLSQEAEQDAIAMGWINKLADYGRRINTKARIETDSDMLTLQIVALFNLIFGFFWSSALVENLSGKAADDVGLRAIQKDLLAAFVDSLRH